MKTTAKNHIRTVVLMFIAAMGILGFGLFIGKVLEWI